MLNHYKHINIKASEIQKVISDYKLHIYKNIWHYSFNDEFQQNEFKLAKAKDDLKFLYSKAHNQFSPLLVYTNADSRISLKVKNAIISEFNEGDEDYRNIFWFLEIQSFHQFLERRSKNSSKPKKHFPTLESYDKYKSKINGEVFLSEFEKKFFFTHYNDLRQSEHMSGEDLFDLFRKNNPNIELGWLRTAWLTHDNSIVAIGIIVDDGKSLNLENIAAKRDSLSFGVFLCTELVKYCCENNYRSFDAGVSGLYGSYKQKIFLDSQEVYREPEKFSRYFHFWEKSYWQKVKNKLFLAS
jgi:hypothetical protein